MVYDLRPGRRLLEVPTWAHRGEEADGVPEGGMGAAGVGAWKGGLKKAAAGAVAGVGGVGAGVAAAQKERERGKGKEVE